MRDSDMDSHRDDLDVLKLSDSELSQLVDHARSALGGRKLGKSDAEDLVQDAVVSTAKRIRDGKLDGLKDRRDVMRYLTVAIDRKAASGGRRAKLEPRGESAMPPDIGHPDSNEGAAHPEDAMETLEGLALEFLRRPAPKLASLFPTLPRTFVSQLAKYYNRPPEDLLRSLDRRFAIVMYLLYGAEREGRFWSAVQRVIRSSCVFEMLQALTEDSDFEEALAVILGPYPKDVDDGLALLREDFDETLENLIDVLGKHTRRRDWRKRELHKVDGPARPRGRTARKGGRARRS